MPNPQRRSIWFPVNLMGFTTPVVLVVTLIVAVVALSSWLHDLHASEMTAAAWKSDSASQLMVMSDEHSTLAPRNKSSMRSALQPVTKKIPAMSFDGRPLRVIGSVTMTVTAYSPDSRSCGKDAKGITASGYSVWTNGMKLAAADARLLGFGSLVSIPGYNQNRPVPVLDRGGAIKGLKLDVLFPTHEAAQQWGKKTISVLVWDYAD